MFFLHHLTLYCIMLYYVVLWYNILYYIILYITLFCIILNIKLYCNKFEWPSATQVRSRFPNGLPNLTPSALSRVSLANQLYHLTVKVVKWAVEARCIFVVENRQFSLFWATTFWSEIAHLAMYSVFQSCQYGAHGKRKQNNVCFQFRWIFGYLCTMPWTKQQT